MTKIKSLAFETAIYGIPSIVGRFLNYLLVPLYTYNLLPKDYGIIANLYGWMAFLLVILTFGMETGFFRFASDEGNEEKVFSTSFGFVGMLSVIFAGAVLLFQKPVSVFLEYPDYVDLVVYTALIVSLDALSAIPFAKLRLDKKAIRFALLKITNIAVNIFANVLFFIVLPWMVDKRNIEISWFSQDKLLHYVFISNLLASAVTFVLVSLSAGIKSFHWDNTIFRKLLSYSTPIFVVGLAGMVNMFGDRVLYPFIFDNADIAQRQLGIYSANYKIGVLMVLFTQAFRYAYEPFIFNNRKNVDSQQKFGEIMTHFVWFGMLIVMGVLFFLPVIQYIIGGNYRDGLKIVPYILVANLLMGIAFNLSVWYKLTDKTRFGAYFNTAAAVVIVVINIVFVPVFGYIASAWAAVASNLLIVSLSYYFMRKHYPIPYNFKKIAEYVGLAVVLIVINNLLGINSEIMANIVRSFMVVLYIAYYVKKENVLKILKR